METSIQTHVFNISLHQFIIRGSMPHYLSLHAPWLVSLEDQVLELVLKESKH